MIYALPFIVGSWIPVWCGWTNNVGFAVSTTIIMAILLFTGQIKLLPEFK